MITREHTAEQLHLISHSIAVGSDAMGTITFAGEGASSAQNTIDTTAAGDIGITLSAWYTTRNA